MASKAGCTCHQFSRIPSSHHHPVLLAVTVWQRRPPSRLPIQRAGKLPRHRIPVGDRNRRHATGNGRVRGTKEHQPVILDVSPIPCYFFFYSERSEVSNFDRGVSPRCPQNSARSEKKNLSVCHTFWFQFCNTHTLVLAFLSPNTTHLAASVQHTATHTRAQRANTHAPGGATPAWP